ncbi:hypothetical protein EN851_03515 [Mesorhizobium sp. M8A.F.Ca.ET.208.01.1.1]|uniref:hypothetical protein n=1 Tax=Mesorhizobium sp. M8A.F.Ca.ET.167.01.1.1 TaxID=2563961 RepID=UPI001093FFD2|nr:hypothetical protein [Mesorhizobium sp. M8A.F.Ca.ET.167.01.1.1]TGQ94633.1 hypothetical protein EN851_03515 [Mesorhizobium sp. M8A.F.Ca.ET.208.01.1.1]TGT55120.1 hypothetical protein EN810_03515 [Mesorhizobium sp. M8A.F.Ca.ET.167.01.1.1]
MDNQRDYQTFELEALRARPRTEGPPTKGWTPWKAGAGIPPSAAELFKQIHWRYSSDIRRIVSKRSSVLERSGTPKGRDGFQAFQQLSLSNRPDQCN